MIETEMMLIHTVNFGDIEVPEDRIINFKEGVPGFPHIRKFVVLEVEDVKPFQYLQSLDDPPIALLIVNPFVVDAGYKFQLSKSDMEDIHSADPGQLTVYAVVTIPENPEHATVNLLAPIVINEKMRCGKQIVLHDTGYSVKHPVFDTSKGEAQKTNEQKAGG